MMNILRQLGRSRRVPASRGSARIARLAVERLESLIVPAPLPPAGVTAIGASASSIALSWNAPTDPAVTGFNVYERTWVVPPHGGRGSSGGGHYVYNIIAGNVPTNSDTITGLATGTTHTYLVSAIDPTGVSPYSAPASAETWVAPSQPYSSEFELSSGAVWSGPVTVQAGSAVQILLLEAGNPLNYSVGVGPATVSVNSSGVVTYTPGQNEVGLNTFTFNISNSLGSVSQQIQFDVTPTDPSLATPTVILGGGPFTYNTYSQTVSATAVGTDGITPVSGSITINYNGYVGTPINAGTYNVLATFTSSDPSYGPAYAFGTMTIDKATPTIGGLSDQTFTVGAATTTVSGYIWAGTSVPAAENVIVSLDGLVFDAPVSTGGVFSATFNTSALAVGSYSVNYSYYGDSNLTAAPDATSILNIIPTAPPQVTLNPVNHTLEAPDPVSFTAAATGSPNPTCQWQVSTDGGATFSNISGATSTTYSIANTYGGLNGNYYRAVFSNGIGSPGITTAAKLNIQFAPIVTSNPVSESVALGQAATFTAAVNANPGATIRWQESVNGGAFTNIAGATSTSYTFTPKATDNGDQFRAVFTNDVGVTNSAAASLTIVAPTTVAAVQVNDGSAQRSEVRSISVTFSGPVTFAGGNANAAAAFTLQHLTDGNNVILSSAVSTDSQGRTVVTLTFSGAETDAVSATNGGVASLADGRYTLDIASASVLGSTGGTLDGNGDGMVGGNYVSPTDTQGGGPGQLHLYRLFGDATGDGVVDATDLGQLRGTFNASAGSAIYLSYLDADNSGTVDSQDFGQFRSRFNGRVF